MVGADAPSSRAITSKSSFEGARSYSNSRGLGETSRRTLQRKRLVRSERRETIQTATSREVVRATKRCQIKRPERRNRRRQFSNAPSWSEYERSPRSSSSACAIRQHRLTRIRREKRCVVANLAAEQMSATKVQVQQQIAQQEAAILEHPSPRLLAVAGDRTGNTNATLRSTRSGRALPNACRRQRLTTTGWLAAKVVVVIPTRADRAGVRVSTGQ